jgi:hypothetical protein
MRLQFAAPLQIAFASRRFAGPRSKIIEAQHGLLSGSLVIRDRIAVLEPWAAPAFDVESKFLRERQVLL